MIDINNINKLKIGNREDIKNFLSKRGIDIDEAYKSSLGVMDEGLKRATIDSSSENFISELETMRKQLSTHGLDMLLDYDEKKNEIVILTYPKGEDPKDFIKQKGGKGTGKIKYTTYNKDKVAVTMIPLPDAGGATMGAGRDFNRPVGVYGKGGEADTFYRSSMAQLKYINKSLQNKSRTSGIKDVQSSFKYGRESIRKVYNQFNKEAVKEQKEAQKVKGTGSLYAAENQISANTAFVGEYLRDLALANQINGRAETILSGIADRIFMSKNRALEVEAILKSEEFKQFTRITGKDKGKDLLQRLKTFGDRYHLEDLTFKPVNESSIDRGVAGSASKKIINDWFDSAIQRSQDYKQTPRRNRGVKKGEAPVWVRSAIKSTQQLKDAGIVKGGGVKKGQDAPYDAQTLMVYVVPNNEQTDKTTGRTRYGASYGDQIIASDAGTLSLGTQRQVTYKISTDELKQAKNFLQDSQFVFDPKTGEMFKLHQGGSGRVWTSTGGFAISFKELQKQNKTLAETIKYNYVLRKKIKEAGRDTKNFGFSPRNIPLSSRDFNLGDRFFNRETGLIEVSLLERLPGETGAKATGFHTMAKGSIVRNQSEIERLRAENSRYYGGAHYAIAGSDMNNVRKGASFLSEMMDTLIQEYGSSIGLNKKFGEQGLIDNLKAIETGAGELKYDQILAKAIQSVFTDGGHDFTKFMPSVLQAMKESGINEKKLADVMMHLMPLVDRLINGIDENTGAIKTTADFESSANQDRYFNVKRNKAGNVVGYDFSGKNIRLIGSLKQSDEYKWGEVDLRKPSASLDFDLEELLRRGKISNAEYAKRRAEIDNFKKDYILASQESREELERQKKSFNDAYYKTLETASEGFNFDKYNNKTVIRIGDQEGQYAFGQNVKLVDIDKLKRSEYGEIDPNELGEMIRAKISEAIASGVSENDIEIMVDPGLKHGEGFSLGDKGGYGKYFFIDKKNFLNVEGNYATGKGGLFDTSGGLATLSNAIFKYQENKNSVEFGKMFGEILHQMGNDVLNEAGAKYSYYTNTKAKGSTGLKILGMDEDWLTDYYEAGDNVNALSYEQRLKGELAKSGALISEELGKQALEELTDKELKNIVELFKKGGSDNKSRRALIETVAKYYTIDSAEFKDAMSKIKTEDEYDKMFGEGLRMIFARSPYSHLRDFSYTRAFIDSDLKGTQDIKVGVSPLFKHGADFDGDVASVMIMPKDYYGLFDTLQSGQENVDDLIAYAKYKDIVEKQVKAGKIRTGDAKTGTAVTKDVMAKMINPEFGNRAALEQRIQKTGTGILANWRAEFAAYLKDKVSKGGSVTEDEQLALSLFEGIAQDAISSKKVVNNLIRLGLGDNAKNWKDKEIDKLTDEDLEAYGAGWGNINNLIQTAYSKGSAEDFKKALENIGLIEDGYFKTEKKEIIAHPLMNISQTAEGRKYLVENVLKDVLNKKEKEAFLNSSGFTRADIDKLGDKLFQIPIEALFGVEGGQVGALNSITFGGTSPLKFRDLLTQLTRKKHSSEKVDYTTDKIDFQGKSDIIKKVSKDILEYQNRVNATADAVNAEAQAEQNKIGIAKKEGKAFKDNVGTLSKYEQALENITEQSGDFENVTNRVYKSLQGVSGLIREGKSVPLLDLQKQNYAQTFGQALYDEQATKEQNKEFARIRSGAFNEWAKNFDDVDLAAMYGYKDIDKFISERGDIGLSSAIGTFSHAIEQIVLEAKNLLKENESKVDVNNIDEVLAIAKTNKVLKQAGIKDWYDRELETLRNQAVLLYGGGAVMDAKTGAQFIDEDLQQRFLMAKFAGSAMAQSFYSNGKATGAPLYSRIVGNEVPLITKDEYGTSLYGRADQVAISADGKALVISDNKYTKGGLKGTEIGQQLFYNLQSNELRDELKEFIKAGGEVEDWLERKNYGRSPRNQMSLDFANALKSTAYTTNEIRKINAETGNIEIYTIDADSVSKDTKGKLKQGLTLSSEDNRAMLASAKLSRIEEIRDEDISKYITDKAQQEEILKVRKQRRAAAVSKEDVKLITEYINLLKTQKEVELDLYKIEEQKKALEAQGKDTKELEVRQMRLEDQKKSFDDQLKDEKFSKIKNTEEILKKEKELEEENTGKKLEFEHRYNAQAEEAYAKEYTSLFEERFKLQTKRELYAKGLLTVEPEEVQKEYQNVIDAADKRIAEITSKLEEIKSKSTTIDSDFETNLNNAAVLYNKKNSEELKEVSEALKSYNSLLKERYEIELELRKLEEIKEKKYAGVRGFKTADIDEQIENAKKALTEYDDVIASHPITKAGYADDSIASELKAKNDRAFSKYQGDVKLEAEQSAEADYQRLYSNRLSIESQLMSYQHQYDLSFGKQKDTLGEVVNILQQKLSLNQDEIAKLEATNLLRDSEKKKILENYEFEKKVASIREGARRGGATSIWDVMANDIRRATMRVADFGIAARLLNKIPQDIQKVIQYTKELDAAMTNIRVVTGASAEEAQTLARGYTKLAKELGVTTVEIANSANEWNRQGYEAEEANQLIVASSKLAKLGMISTTEATKDLTSAIKGFKLSTEEAMSVVDKLTKIDQVAAISAGNLAEGLARVATTAQQAGLSLDETAAMVTTITEVTQRDASTAGEALRTLISRYSNVKAGVFTSMGEEAEETSKNINDIEKVLGKLGIRIRTSGTEMRSIEDVLDELAEKWDTLDDVSRNAVASAFAGRMTYARNYGNIIC